MAILLSCASIHDISCFNSVKVVSFAKSISIRAMLASSLDYSSASVAEKSSISSSSVDKWQWKYRDATINIHFEKFEKDGSEPSMNILLVPTISDVSTVDEWRSVVKDIVERDGKMGWRATIMDWPGLGYPDRPKLDYVADVMENFLVDFVNAPNSPISNSAKDLVVFGGHSVTILARAAMKDLEKPKAITVVAPTWAGPLPIVFGRDYAMES